MSPPFQQHLQGIEQWLCIHAPKIAHESFNLPATTDQVNQVE
ncbi:hypothetical protein [Acinetobacter sp. MD2]|nr:hypothetical protein [Acinetobacter sp. MD2]